MVNQMVKESLLSQMEKSMKGNTRMEKGTVKEHTLGMMEESMLGNTRVV